MDGLCTKGRGGRVISNGAGTLCLSAPMSGCSPAACLQFTLWDFLCLHEHKNGLHKRPNNMPSMHVHTPESHEVNRRGLSNIIMACQQS